MSAKYRFKDVNWCIKLNPDLSEKIIQASRQYQITQQSIFELALENYLNQLNQNNQS